MPSPEKPEPTMAMSTAAGRVSVEASSVVMPCRITVTRPARFPAEAGGARGAGGEGREAAALPDRERRPRPAQADEVDAHRVGAAKWPPRRQREKHVRLTVTDAGGDVHVDKQTLIVANAPYRHSGAGSWR